MKREINLLLVFFLVVMFLGSVSANESYGVDSRTNCIQINATHRQCVQGSSVVNALDDDGVWKSCEEVLSYEVGDNFIEFNFGVNKTRLEWDYDVKYIGFINFIKRLFANVEADASLDVEKRGCGFYFLQNFENDEFVLDELKYKMPKGFKFEGNVLRNEGSGIFIDFNQAVYEQNVEIIESSGELVFSGGNISRLDPVVGYQPASVNTPYDMPSDDGIWANPTNVFVDDTSYSSCNDVARTATGTPMVNVSGFGFTIPAGATIEGVRVGIISQEDSDDFTYITIQLATGGVGIGNNIAGGYGTYWVPGSFAQQYFGSISVNSWGATLTPSVVNDANFGWITRAIADADTTGDWDIDYISMAVNYTEGVSDLDYPIFTDINDNNGTLVDSGTVIINATISSTNGTAGVEFNGTNYTASNVSDFFNVSFSVDSAGDYSYFWWALGNGSSNNFNKSDDQSYNILISPTPPQINFTNPTPPNGTSTTNTSVVINVSIEEANLQNVSWNWNGVNYSLYDDSLVLMMNFENRSELGENDSAVVDLSRYSNNGTADGAKVDTTNCKYGNCYSFDGADDVIDVGASESLNITSEITLTVWIKVETGQKSTQSNIYWDSNAWATGTVLRYNRDTARVSFFHNNGTGSTAKHGTTNINSGEWTFVAAKYEDATDTVTLFTNEINETNTGSHSALVKNFLGGKIGDLSIYDFNGSIDELRIYNRSLSNAEIMQIYYSNLQKFNSSHWELYINESDLTTQNYTYSATACNSLHSCNSTETRTLSASIIGCIYNTECAADEYCLNSICSNLSAGGKLLVKNSSGSIVASIDSSGNLGIVGGFNDSNSAVCSASANNAFNINDGSIVRSWINETGYMCIGGSLYENMGANLDCSNSFIIKDSSGNNKVCISKVSGNLTLSGYLGKNV